MKRTHTLLAASLGLSLGLSACDLDLTEINQNPNAPTDVPAASILPDATIEAVELVLGYNLNLDLTEHWVQHTAEIQYPEEDLYQYRGTEVDNAWRDFYAEPLADFRTIARKAEEDGNQNLAAVAEIMQVWTYMVMTDMWGDIPYSEALTGADEGGTIQPKYDPQSEIYPDLIARLEAAAAMIDAGATADFGSLDLIYGGNMARWERFANSLRLRLGMRLSEVDPATARRVVASAIAAGVFNSNTDNATLEYLGAQPNQNPWFEAIDPSVGGRPGDFRVSETLVDTLKALDDPRLAVYAMPAADGGDFVGYPNGLDEQLMGLTETSVIGESVAAADAPAVLMSYAEVLFLLSEAAARGWTGGNAGALWRDGIAASMAMWGITPDRIQAYLAQPEVQWNGANWRQLIGFQKWVALFGNGPEAFAEWRRLDYPVLYAGPDADFDLLPRRYPYADSELTFNQANLNEAVSRQGNAGLQGTVWWDVD